MGLRTPQDLAASQSQTRALPNSRTQSIAPTPISTKAIDQVEAVVDAREKARIEQETKQLNFVKSQFNVAGDSERIKAEAKVGSTSGFRTEDERRKERDQLISSLNERLDKFPPKYRAYLETEAQKQANKYDKATLKYAAKQMQSAEMKGLDTQIATGLDDLVTFSGDQRDFSEQLESVRGYVTEKGRNTYGFDDSRVLENGLTVGETLANDAKVAVSDGVVRSVIFQAQTAEDLDRAKLLFTSYYDQLTDGDKIKADKAIKQAESSTENRVALDMADSILKESGGDLVKAEAMVASDPAVTQALYTKVMANIKNKNFVGKEQERKNEDNLMAQAYEIASQGKDIGGVLKQLPPDKQQEIVDHLNKNGGNPTPTRTDFNVLNKAWNDVYMRGPEVAKDPNFINKLKWSVAPDQLAPIQAEWMRLHRAETNEIAKIQRSTSRAISHQINTFLDTNNVIKPEERGAVMTNAMQYYDDLITKNPKITAREIELHINKVLNNSITPKVERKLFSPSTWFNARDRKIEVPTQVQEVIDPTWTELVRSKAKASGRENLSDEDVKKVLDANKRKNPRLDYSQPYKGK